MLLQLTGRSHDLSSKTDSADLELWGRRTVTLLYVTLYRTGGTVCSYTHTHMPTALPNHPFWPPNART